MFDTDNKKALRKKHERASRIGTQGMGSGGPASAQRNGTILQDLKLTEALVTELNAVKSTVEGYMIKIEELTEENRRD